MKDKIEELLRDYQDREARVSLSFFLCFNIKEDECKFTRDDIQKAVYNTLDKLGVVE